jgi:hypothetical protein
MLQVSLPVVLVLTICLVYDFKALIEQLDLFIIFDIEPVTAF